MPAAVRLFAERARMADATFEIDAAAEQILGEVCRRLDGLPLAIELAAARIRLLPPAALLRRLDRQLQLLADGPHDAPDRQRTIRATIDWSYQLLSGAEQRLFAQLAVFEGGLPASARYCNWSGLVWFDGFGAGPGAYLTLLPAPDRCRVLRAAGRVKGRGAPA